MNDCRAQANKTWLVRVGDAGMIPDREHPTRTRRSELRYIFTGKHHLGKSSKDAQWLPELTDDEEFAVFEIADLHELADERRWLYGVLPDEDGELRFIGTWNQQMAEFPLANEGQPWHGYPIWPANELAPHRRGGEKYRPARTVFDRMSEVGLMTKRQKHRLLKGDEA